MRSHLVWDDLQVLEHLEDEGLVEESGGGAYALVCKEGRLRRYRASGRRRDGGGWMALEQILQRLPRVTPGDLAGMVRAGVLETTPEGDGRLYRMRRR